MIDDLNEIETLIRIELRHGLTKKVGVNPSNDKIEEIEKNLMAILHKNKEEMKIKTPVPRVRMWLTNDQVNFMFFDKNTGKRVILGEWLANKGTTYER